MPLAFCCLGLQLDAQTDSAYDGFVHPFWTGDSNHARYGLMDTAGNVICRPSFSQIGAPFFDFKSGPVPAAKGRKWGFINPKGEWVVRPQFSDANHFHGGLAYVILSDDPKDRRSGYINHRGQVVWQFKDKYPVEILRF